MEVVRADLDDTYVIALLRYHAESARAQTAPGSAHALDPQALRAPEITVFAARDGVALLGVGALKRLADGTGEVKAMHTVEAARGRGVGTAILERIVETARAQGLSRLSLETGAWAYFAPAEAFYKRHGFVPCPPFADYAEDPNSLFLTRRLVG
jgi:putative acetyltransferase